MQLSCLATTPTLPTPNTSEASIPAAVWLKWLTVSEVDKNAPIFCFCKHHNAENRCMWHTWCIKYGGQKVIFAEPYKSAWAQPHIIKADRFAGRKVRSAPNHPHQPSHAVPIKAECGDFWLRPALICTLTTSSPFKKSPFY